MSYGIIQEDQMSFACLIKKKSAVILISMGKGCFLDKRK